jgi:hypothetical protein
MSKRELGRVEVLARVRSKQLQVVDAGRLMRVSYRQAKRLWKRMDETTLHGASDHKKQAAKCDRRRSRQPRGRPSVTLPRTLSYFRAISVTIERWVNSR